MLNREKLIQIGIISSAYGIKGEVVVRSFSDSVSNIMQYSLKSSKGDPIKLDFIKTINKHKIVCRIDGIQTRTEAEQLSGTSLYVYQYELKEIEDDSEHYMVDLIGVIVKDADGTIIGMINNFYNYGAGDIVEIEYNDGKMMMYPFTEKIFPTVTKDFITLCPPNFI